MSGEEFFEDAIRNRLMEVADLVISKQRDYGSDNLKEFGELGIVIRLNDKMNRLKNLLENNKLPKNESVEDTLRDMIGYAVLLLMMRDGSLDLPLQEE